jgi:hypothetical protein
MGGCLRWWLVIVCASNGKIWTPTVGTARRGGTGLVRHHMVATSGLDSRRWMGHGHTHRP